MQFPTSQLPSADMEYVLNRVQNMLQQIYRLEILQMANRCAFNVFQTYLGSAVGTVAQNAIPLMKIIFKITPGHSV